MDNRKSKTSPGQNKMTPSTVEQNILGNKQMKQTTTSERETSSLFY